MRNSNKQVSFIPAAVTSVIALTGAFMMLITSFAEPDPKRCISPVKYIAELPQTIETYDNSDDFIYSYPSEDNVKIPPEIPGVIPETVAIEDEIYTEVPEAQLEEEYSTQNYERNTIPNIYDYVINKRIHTEGDINEETYDYLIEEIWKQQDFVLQKFAENEENQIIIAAFSEFNEKMRRMLRRNH